MSTEYEITTIKKVIDIGTTLSRSWFRGQSKAYDDLTPKIFRPEWMQIQKCRKDLESSMIEKFKNEAPALETRLPDEKDHIRWLFFMQHHGLPTRLLDWTTNILVALYFAVNENKSESGELWAIYPYELNKKSRLGMPLNNNKILNYYALEPYIVDNSKVLETLKLNDIPRFPIAIEPKLMFLRMMAQSSVFTIHPDPDHGKSIKELLTKREHLVRYIIPSSSKCKLLDDLSLLGITKRALFPSLDSLAEEIISYHRIVAYTPPIPPK